MERTESTDYNKQANDFLTEHHLTLDTAFKGDKCPPWRKGKPTSRDACPECGSVHGDLYRVTIRRPTHDAVWSNGEPGPRSLSFNFWGSYADQQDGNRPSAYDVLACISSEVYCPESFGLFCSDFGYDQDSRQAEATFKRCAAFAVKLGAFFSESELEALAEIR